MSKKQIDETVIIEIIATYDPHADPDTPPVMILQLETNDSSEPAVSAVLEAALSSASQRAAHSSTEPYLTAIAASHGEIDGYPNLFGLDTRGRVWNIHGGGYGGGYGDNTWARLPPLPKEQQ